MTRYNVTIQHVLLWLQRNMCCYDYSVTIYTLQITTWLRESAGKFLETRVDVGMSLETAEDLLSELGEFEIRAKVLPHVC